MKLEELLNKIQENDSYKELSSALLLEQARINLINLHGSGLPLIVGNQMANGGTHLLIANDKEEAAYLFNDLVQLFDKKKNILFFPDSYRQPYQVENIDNANVVMRAEVLAKLSKFTKSIVIVSYPSALAEKVVSKANLSKNTYDLRVGEEYDLDMLNELLIDYEFESVDYVYEPGQFSIRGGILDIFSFSNDLPYRLEFFGDEVESIRIFNPEDQLSIKRIQRISLIPNVQKKLLKEQRQTILEFIPQSTNVWLADYELITGQLEKAFDKATYAFDKLESPLDHLAPSELYMSAKIFQYQLERLSVIEYAEKSHFSGEKINFDVHPQPVFNKNFDMLADFLEQQSKAGYKNFFFTNNANQFERLVNIFSDKEREIQIDPVLKSIHGGFIDNQNKIVALTDHQVFERYHRYKLKEGFKKSSASLTLKELNSLKKGDFVVHADHGVGQFSGLEKIDVNGKAQEAIRLVYHGNDILYVSIHSLHRISRYSGEEGHKPKMNKLGSPAWTNTKNKTKKQIKELAFDLIKLYAKRKASKGFAFAPDSYLQHEMEASFMYEDTPDQEKATTAIKGDMEAENPMDRLVCGDVGFGKTELAMRAAFKAVADSKQVAMLVPTTILTLQHYKNFKKRFKDFPVTVEYLNRFKSTKKQTELWKRLEAGEVDIVIGTHALVSKKAKFKHLGLLIIDEEQKFGVGVKDKLKTLKTNIDSLTLTATPIPRTLQFSLMGARDLSILRTPPPNRQPVQTEVKAFNEEVIRDAIMYEVSRGGQVYFVHNRVQNIQEVAGMLQRMCPDVRIAIGHGQMDGARLEEIMFDFIEGMYDVLIATTIIESGIDIPNANTMIINDAHKFGLSDLHQLRGRVGRSNKKAFCYLLCPPVTHLSSDARKRIQAITQFSDLGSGFNIAMRDLDIRGAGNLLGAEQSGFIADIGIEMYQRILKESMTELKENEFKELFKDEEKEFVEDCTIETDMQLLIPDDYVNEIAERLILYKELDSLEERIELENFKQMMEDRFGPLPHSTEELIKTVRMRWLAKSIGINRLILKNDKMVAYFVENPESDYYQTEMFTKVLAFVQKHQSKAKMSEKNGKLRISFIGISSISDAIETLSIIEPEKEFNPIEKEIPEEVEES